MSDEPDVCYSHQGAEGVLMSVIQDGDTGVYRVMPQLAARRVLASGWYAERIAEARREGAAEAWDEAVQAMAWCLDNGPTEAALPYVAEHNPHRAAARGDV